MADLEVKRGPVTTFGWVRRTDLGPNVWETPDGKLFKADGDATPMLVKVDNLRTVQQMAGVFDNARALFVDFPDFHKDWAAIADWLPTQPPEVQEAAQQNATAIVDYEAAHTVLSRFYAERRA